MDNFIPYPDKIVVEPQGANVEWREGGDEEFGKVVKLGDGAKRVGNVKVGDILYFKMRGVDEIKLDDKKYYIIADRPEFISGVVRTKSTVAK